MRTRVGESTYAGGFIVHWVDNILFWDAPAWMFTVCYTLFGSVVLVTFVIGQPRWPWSNRRWSEDNP